MWLNLMRRRFPVRRRSFAPGRSLVPSPQRSYGALQGCITYATHEHALQLLEARGGAERCPQQRETMAAR
eukprot:655077-Karenia_brevis.AAC.1